MLPYPILYSITWGCIAMIQLLLLKGHEIWQKICILLASSGWKSNFAAAMTLCLIFCCKGFRVASAFKSQWAGTAVCFVFAEGASAASAAWLQLRGQYVWGGASAGCGAGEILFENKWALGGRNCPCHTGLLHRGTNQQHQCVTWHFKMPHLFVCCCFFKNV